MNLNFHQAIVAILSIVLSFFTFATAPVLAATASDARCTTTTFAKGKVVTTNCKTPRCVTTTFARGTGMAEVVTTSCKTYTTTVVNNIILSPPQYRQWENVTLHWKKTENEQCTDVKSKYFPNPTSGNRSSDNFNIRNCSGRYLRWTVPQDFFFQVKKANDNTDEFGGEYLTNGSITNNPSRNISGDYQIYIANPIDPYHSTVSTSRNFSVYVHAINFR